VQRGRNGERAERPFELVRLAVEAASSVSSHSRRRSVLSPCVKPAA
jgi:hypothetical protein